MKFNVISAAMIMTAISANCQENATTTNTTLDWAPAGQNDLRGPCPMLNTLANHGFLPHDGTNITQEKIIFAIKTALNFNETFAVQFFSHGVKSNPEPNATFFTLDMLNRHNVLEHDASLSRQDAFFGNNHVFNQSIFDETKKFWTADTLTLEMVANSMTARQLNMKAFNPEYIFTEASQVVTFGEMAAPFLVFGDKEAGTVPKNFVTFWIENEKLPTELGWVKPAVELIQDDVGIMSARIANATSPIRETAAAAAACRDIGYGHGLL